MPRFHPQQSVLSGLGVAGAVLAAAVVTFALASGIIAYSLTSADPLARSHDALVLDTRHAGDLASKPLVLHRAAPATAPRGRSPLAGTAGTAAVRGANGSLSPQGGGRGSGGGFTGGDDSPGQPQPVAGSARRPVGKALGETTQAVGTTTGTLARRLQDVTGDLHTRAAPLLLNTGAAVRRVVGGTSGAVGRVLGGPPAR